MQNEHKGLDFRSGRIGKGKGIKPNEVVEHGWEGNERANGVKAVKTGGLQTFYNAIAPETFRVSAEDRKGGRSMNELKIEYLSPEELTPYENNTRKHAPDDVEQIKKSILEDGFNDPIGIWGEKNLIVEGHGRQIAALELHLDKVPVIRLDHMTDAQRRDYAIRHNRTAELSAWDFSKLEEEIAALKIEGFDLSGLKFEFEQEEEQNERNEVKLKENFQLIIDCESEEDMQLKYEQLQEMGIECRTSTL